KFLKAIKLLNEVRGTVQIHKICTLAGKGLATDIKFQLCRIPESKTKNNMKPCVKKGTANKNPPGSPIPRMQGKKEVRQVPMNNGPGDNSTRRPKWWESRDDQKWTKRS